VDLGISGRKAIVCASSRGLGRACAETLASAGVELVINGREHPALIRTADYLSETYNVNITPVAGDIASEAGRAAVLAACPDADILINNAGGPPPGDFREWERDHWIAAVNANMVTPILLIKATIDGMIERGFGRIINITSAAVKSPIGTLGLSNGARAGLTGFVAGLSRDVAKHGVTVNNLLPGPFETDRLNSNIADAAKRQNISFDEAWETRKKSNPSRRFGRPEEFGAFCGFIASQHAGYLTGQNILLDGGAYPGTL